MSSHPLISKFRVDALRQPLKRKFRLAATVAAVAGFTIEVVSPAFAGLGMLEASAWFTRAIAPSHEGRPRAGARVDSLKTRVPS